ncbi:MAG: diguanylate cyclase [Syntrophorhabdus aromaticivorans]|uniref:Diguanylate cyclase n=1 Tax=Syntrophorhabdus aromaticivorans TaxID=328301 RepID=A0A971S017_9BACT|nr:diguanylate cyclase [Syntrophorhabdus aromaticivorans]
MPASKRLREKPTSLGSAGETGRAERDDRVSERRGHEDTQALLRLILNVSTNFINLPSDMVDGGIDGALKLIADFIHVDRSYVFQLSPSRSEMSNTHEWCARGVESKIQGSRAIPAHDFPWFWEIISGGEVFNATDMSMSGLSLCAKTRKADRRFKDVQSLLVVPIASRGPAMGFIGFDAVRERKTWSEETVSLLGTLGEIFANVLEWKRFEESLREGERRYQTLFECANDAIFFMRETVFVDCNSQALKMFGCTVEQVVGQPVFRLTPPAQPGGTDSRETLLEKIYAALFGYRQFFEWQCCRYDGTPFDAEINLNRIEMADSTFVQAIVRDISQRKETEEALRKSEEKYRTLFEESRDAIYITASNGRILDANQAFQELFGYTREEVLAANAKDSYVSAEEGKTLGELLRKRGYVKDFELRLRKKDDTVMDCLVSVNTKTGEDGRIIKCRGIVRDVTAHKKARETIRHMAYHDLLTGLPNRMLFHDRLNMAMAGAQRNGSSIAVMMLDLDKFKDINDNMGHEAGDILLKTVAQRLDGMLRKSGTVARMGGDEFLLILPDIKGMKAVFAVAERIMDLFRKPLIINGSDVSTTASMGVALYPEDGKEAEALVRHADMAMYHAKAEGGNRYFRYTPGINRN